MAELPQPTVPWALFSFRGRIARQSYILGQLFMLSLFGIVVARIVAVHGDESATVFWGLAMFALLGLSLWSALALTAKRLHDLNQPVALIVLLFIAPVNVLFVIALMAMPSHPDENAHGPPPFARA